MNVIPFIGHCNQTPVKTPLVRTALRADGYHDIPMDWADASLVAVVESRDFRTLFTLDSDFFIYRPQDSSAMVVLHLVVVSCVCYCKN